MAVALVTGITGQDGGYLAEQLVAAGDRVHGTVLDEAHLDGVPAHLAALGDAVELHVADLGRPEELTGLVDRLGPDVVFNLAGLSSVAASWEDPVATFDVNARAVLALLEHLHRRSGEGHDVRFVQASSGEVFAGAGPAPITERSPVSPVNPYGTAKAAAHLAVGIYRARGLHASSLVLFNHESPRRPAQFVTRKITRGAAAIAAGRADALTLGNLEVSRDWGWAPDYARAMVLAAGAEQGDDYVVATGQAHSLRDLVAAAFAEVGIPDWQRFLHSDPALVRPADAQVLVGDSTRLRERLGWAPSVSFEEMVAAMVRSDVEELS
jgi:GDPmannose 4,6-dehydratase